MSFIGPEGRKQLQLAARFAAAGLELAIAIVIGYFGGRAVDRWLGTDPYCGYVGLILGVISGFRNLFLLARSANRASSREAAPEPSHANEPSAHDGASPDEPSPKP